MHIQILWRNLIDRDHLKNLGHGCLTFFGKESHLFFFGGGGAGSRATHRKITISGIPKTLKYCRFFIVNT